MTRLLAVCALLVSLAGCAAPAPSSPAIHGAADVQAVTAIALHDAAGRKLLTLTGPLVTGDAAVSQPGSSGMAPWSQADVHHVTLSLFASGQTTAATTLVVPADRLADPVVFPALARNAAYTVVGRAYHSVDDAMPIDTYAADAASCTTPFTTPDAPTAAIGPLVIRLANKVFAGQGRAGVAVTDGTVQDATGAPVIQLVP